nr:50S ribosomal protein L25 [Candidatus Levybacteria bacterium]
MKHEKLKVEKRKVLGKEVKKLRRQGVVPGNVYGKNIKSEAVQADLKEFNSVYQEAGETGLVDLELDGKTIPVLIHNIHKDYKRNVLHADFFQVNLKEKVKTMVPLEIIGEPKAVIDKIGLLMNILSEVEIEALPEELPEKIDVNVEHLANIDDQITVADLKVPVGVEILTDATQVVSKIGELVTKEAAEEAAAAEAAAEAARAEGAAAEGQAVAEEAESAESASEEVKAETPSE